ncbi:HET-domain-containing protein [Whalleya microplaca]|nr:HET-domain-containing protein [Whalleya microplaca]
MDLKDNISSPSPIAGAHLSLSNISTVLTSLPCHMCSTIIPERSNLNFNKGDDILTNYEFFDSYPTYPTLEASFMAGCTLCGLMRKKLTTLSPKVIRSTKNNNDILVWSPFQNREVHLAEVWDRKVKLRVAFKFLVPETVPSSRVSSFERSYPQFGCMITSISVNYRPVSGVLRDEDGKPWSGDTIDFPVFDSPDLYSQEKQYRIRLPSPSSLSEENVDMMRRWIDDCVYNHTECLLTSKVWVPTRLLEINYKNKSLTLRLIDTSNHSLEMGSTFAALSHMWGDMSISRPLRTLKSNYYQLKEEIKGPDMPQNFADSALVCVRLGILYLWIDSLCIIQDSPEDWRHESGLMHLVYRNAIVTIVATSATSCQDGFLCRDVSSIPAVKIAYTSNYSKSEPQGHHMIVCCYDQPQDNQRMFAVNGSKWNTRGWTLQERSLATRMIHFCRNKIFFECRACLTSENNEPAQEMDHMNSILWPRRPSASFKELYQHWQLLLGEYCSRNLTVSSDKLPAIQSIAEEMATASGHDYIRFAGMWLQNLRRELLWFVSFGNATLPIKWRAPSWSWASIEGQITLWQRDFRKVLQAPPGSPLSCVACHPIQVLSIDQAYPDLSSDMCGYLEVNTLAKRIYRISRDGISTSRRDFFPYNLRLAPHKQSPNEVFDSAVFAHGRLDIHSSDGLEDEHDAFLHAHVNDEARATGLILKATRRTSDTVLWRRVGIATLFVDRSEIPIMDDVFTCKDVPEKIVLI